MKKTLLLLFFFLQIIIACKKDNSSSISVPIIDKEALTGNNYKKWIESKYTVDGQEYPIDLCEKKYVYYIYKDNRWTIDRVDSTCSGQHNSRYIFETWRFSIKTDSLYIKNFIGNIISYKIIELSSSMMVLQISADKIDLNDPSKILGQTTAVYYYKPL